MTRLSRILPKVALASSLVVPGVSLVWGQDAAAPAAGNATQGNPTAAADAPAANAPAANATDAQSGQAGAQAQNATVTQDLQNAVEDFWHYAKVARYDLATQAANKAIELGEKSPAAALKAFQQVSTQRGDDLDEWLIRWQRVPELKDATTKIINLVNAGHQAERADQASIEANIKRLNVNERAYVLGVQRLRDSGELAVPMMIDYLRDPNKPEYHTVVRRALVDMGRTGLAPLLAATEMKNDDQTLAQIASILGDIGYDVSVPYLSRLANGQDVAPAVKSAASAALQRMGAGNAASLNSADLFYDLGEKFYYGNAAIQPDPRLETANIWYWEQGRGLVRKEVPTPIYNDVMTMRCCEYALGLDAKKAAAESLWLTANYKREADLPQGATDPTRPENAPSAHFYGVDAGAQYLNPALARTVRDRNAVVSFKIVKSLQQIVGRSNMFSNGAGTPLVDAMVFPDRAVRFEAALAIAAAMPDRSFGGSDRVVPLLAEAVAQTGKPGVLVLAANQDEANKLVDSLKGQGYNAVGATSADAAVLASSQVPAVDAIVIYEDVGAGQIDQFMALGNNNPRLERAPRVIITDTAGSPWVQRAANNPLMSVTQSHDPAQLKGTIDSAREKLHAGNMDEKSATDYALRAANMLQELGIAHNPVLDTTPALNALLGALDDPRADLVRAAGNAVALINSPNAQAGLLIKADDEKTPAELKISLYRSLATAAKFYGNQLSADQVSALQKAVDTGDNLDVRSAAAEATGALNLPTDRARKLILDQSRR